MFPFSKQNTTNLSVIPISVGIEMQFQYRYQTLIWLCILIDIEISLQGVKCIGFAPTDPSVIKNHFANTYTVQN